MKTKIIISTLIIVSCILSPVLLGNSSILENYFASPPDSARPHTWWHWMDGNVSKEGITKDLEAMKQAGIGGFQMFDIGGYLDKGPVDYMSPAWLDLVKFSISEADRLGLEVTIHNCAGWTSSGGPWIAPENAMKFVVWSETSVKGGRQIVKSLKEPMSRSGFYRDIACFALRETPSQGNAVINLKPVISGSEPGFVGSNLCDGDWDSYCPSKQNYIQIEFDEPLTACSAQFAFRKDISSASRIKLQVSVDGKKYKTIGTVYDTFLGRGPGSSNFKPADGRFFRFTFENLTSDLISEISISTRPMVEDFGARAGYFRAENLCPIMSYETKRIPFLKKRDIIDITNYMAADGTVQWEAPAGDWTIIRMGYTVTGTVNRPASSEAEGFECDKFSRAAMKLHFENMMEKVIQDVGPLAGTALKAGLIDSFEVKGQNWTLNMFEDFKNIAGYQLGKHIISLTGRIVGSMEETDKFLYDYRRVLAELMEKNYFGYFDELCEERGLDTCLEPYGNGNFETITATKYTDLPMTEFWVSRPFKSQWIKPVVSAAHIYNKNIIGAESFTGHPKHTRPWSVHPGMIKARGDLIYTFGVNRFIFHTQVHQPWSEKLHPGMTMGPWGTHFDRNNTWWPLASAWIKYLTRCQYLLQQGKYVADVAVYTGEGKPGYFTAPELPYGVNFDFINADILLNHSNSKNGLLELDTGLNYRLLILPDDIRMSSEVALKIEELLEQGVIITGPKPERTWRLNDSDTKLNNIISRFWDKVKPDFSVAIAASGIKPDFISLTNSDDLCFIHRSMGDMDIYFISNQSDMLISPDCRFRVSGKTPEQWNPQTGKIEELAMFASVEEYTQINVMLEPSESTFIVFNNAGSPKVKHVKKHGILTYPKLVNAGNSIIMEVQEEGEYILELTDNKVSEVKVGKLMTPYELTGSWDVHFNPDMRTPVSSVFSRLVSWTQVADENIKYYSGLATYKKDFNFDNAITNDQRLYLDLGDVRELASVRLNGKDLGILWIKPFKVDITEAVNSGMNNLEIDVVNLWPNSLIGDERFADDRGSSWKVWPDWMGEFVKTGQRPSQKRLNFATWKHYSKDDKLIPSGLLGPVTIKATAVKTIPLK